MVAVDDPGNDQARAGGDLRICFLGDSLVQGTGDDCGGWVARLAAASRARGLDLTAYNLGVRGDTSRGIAARWYEEAERRFSDGTDHRVVLSFGVNDADVLDGQRRVLRDRSAVYLSAMLRGAAEAGWPAFVVGPPPVGDSEYLARLHELSEAMHKACVQAGVRFVSLVDHLTDSAGWREALDAGDGFHPVAAGYDLVAEAVASAGWWDWLGQR